MSISPSLLLTATYYLCWSFVLCPFRSIRAFFALLCAPRMISTDTLPRALGPLPSGCVWPMGGSNRRQGRKEVVKFIGYHPACSHHPLSLSCWQLGSRSIILRSWSASARLPPFYGSSLTGLQSYHSLPLSFGSESDKVIFYLLVCRELTTPMNPLTFSTVISSTFIKFSTVELFWAHYLFCVVIFIDILPPGSASIKFDLSNLAGMVSLGGHSAQILLRRCFMIRLT